MTDEARLEDRPAGRTPVTDGWFVVSVPEAAWVRNEAMGAACVFEGDEAPFPQLGFTIAVLQPGQPAGMYHREGNQEDFLVLSGTCLLLIEGQERPLRAWDLVHCPAGTEHGFVATGDTPCVLFMTGAREGWPDGKGIWYPRSEPARAHGVGVESATAIPAEAYARFPDWEAGPPGRWDAGTPFASRLPY
jgi:uncharacterized cupin superfamily protein